MKQNQFNYKKNISLLLIIMSAFNYGQNKKYSRDYEGDSYPLEMLKEAPIMKNSECSDIKDKQCFVIEFLKFIHNNINPEFKGSNKYLNTYIYIEKTGKITDINFYGKDKPEDARYKKEVMRITEKIKITKPGVLLIGDKYYYVPTTFRIKILFR